MQKIIHEALTWRYATKIFDPAKKLSTEELQPVLEAMRLAPSSFGLPLWKAIIITNVDLRTRLRAAAWNQSQITDASHLIVLAIRRTIDEQLVDTYIATTAEVRNTSIESISGYSDMIKGFVKSKSAEWLKEWATRQAYIALGFALETAALHKLDACPMEGFDPQQFDAILGLDALDLESKVIVTIGHRSDEDQSASSTKVRLSDAEVFVEMR